VQPEKQIVSLVKDDGYKSDDDNFDNGMGGSKKANEKYQPSESETFARQSVRNMTGR
jgi:hypothetical protein